MVSVGPMNVDGSKNMVPQNGFTVLTDGKTIVESTEEVRISLQKGVDTIEHRAIPDAEIIQLFKEHNVRYI